MRVRRRSLRLRWTDFVLLPALALLVFLGLPTQWGGQTSYIVVRGDSMLPTYDTGDLVVLRAAGTYRSGDVVAYQVPDDDFGAGTIVLHRIVGSEKDGRLILQGDNNAVRDGWHPTSTDVKGVAVFSVPKAGSIFANARNPALLASMAFGLTFAIAVTPRRPRGQHLATG